MSRRLKGLLAPFVFPICFMVFASDKIISQPFAVVSPEMIARLKASASCAAADSIVRFAGANLLREPDPQPVIHTEGTLPHQGIRDQSLKAMEDMPILLAFGFAYRITGDVRYLAASEKFFSAWLAIYRPSFNPIDETNFSIFILAYDLARADLADSTRDKMEGFLREMAAGYLDCIAHQDPKDIYNWQSHRIKLIVWAAYALGDGILIQQARETFQDHISVNIRPDGSGVDFYRRDALHYVVYNLEPLSSAALAAKAHGEDWFHFRPANSASLAEAVDWLTPFALARKTHEEFVNSTIDFDFARAEAGVPGYSGQWDPRTCAFLYQLTSLLDERNLSIFTEVLKNTGACSSDWLTLVQMAGAEGGRPAEQSIPAVL